MHACTRACTHARAHTRQLEARLCGSPCRLLPYSGRDPRRPLLLAIKGRVLDVRSGVEYYGPEGPYKVMAGRDARCALSLLEWVAG